MVSTSWRETRSSLPADDDMKIPVMRGARDEIIMKLNNRFLGGNRIVSGLIVKKWYDEKNWCNSKRSNR